MKYLDIKVKGEDSLVGCAKCFAILDDEDEFCWNCGEEIEEDYIYDLEDLEKELKLITRKK